MEEVGGTGKRHKKEDTRRNEGYDPNSKEKPASDQKRTKREGS